MLRKLSKLTVRNAPAYSLVTVSVRNPKNELAEDVWNGGSPALRPPARMKTLRVPLPSATLPNRFCDWLVPFLKRNAWVAPTVFETRSTLVTVSVIDLLSLNTWKPDGGGPVPVVATLICPYVTESPTWTPGRYTVWA